MAMQSGCELISERPGPRTRVSRMSWRWAQLLSDARSERRGCQVASRKPVADPNAPELAEWRDAARDVDRRMARFTNATRKACGFRFAQCDDLSRHIYVWYGDKEYTLSLEPRQDGLVEIIASVMQVELVRDAQSLPIVGSVRAVGEWGPDDILSGLDENVRDWIVSALPVELWWSALFEQLKPLLTTYGIMSEVGLAALKVASILNPEGKAKAGACAPFLPTDHPALAALLKLALTFAAPVVGDAPEQIKLREWRATFLELRDAMAEVAACELPDQPNPYLGALV